MKGQGNKNTRFGSNNKDSKGCCSSVMFLSWSLIAIWVLFLGYCWKYGLLDQTKIGNVVNDFEKEIIKVVPHIHITTDPAEPTEPRGVAPIVQTPTDDDGDIHVIFSTDCSPYQDWQTLVIFHSAMMVGQKGKITRIASGCDDEKKAHLIELYGKLYHSKYGVHFTPDFKKDEKTGRGCELV